VPVVPEAPAGYNGAGAGPHYPTTRRLTHRPDGAMIRL